MPTTTNSGINFETLNEGYLRMQYIGGSGYEKKVEEILSTLNQFCVTAWDCTINRGFSKDNLITFEKAVLTRKKIRDAYYDYAIFKQNFPKIEFTIDLVGDKKVLESYYNILRDRIYDIVSNITIKGGFELNYDSSLSVFQIKDADISCRNIAGVEFIKCKILYGTFTKCDFFDCEIQDAILSQSNLFLHTQAKRCNLYDSFANRTTEIINSEIDGISGVLNGKMEGGIFKKGKVGLFADISPETTVIQYQPLKTGYVVAGDQIIIPTKKFNQL
jgi:hypothetical protein